MIVAGRFSLPENVTMNPFEGCMGLGSLSGPGNFYNGVYKSFGPSPGPLVTSLGALIPTTSQLAGLQGDDCGCGCNGAGTCGGLGDFSLDGLLQPLQNEVFGIPVWMLAGGALLLVMFMGSRGSASSGYRAAKAQAKARYYKDLKSADEQYGRRYKRYGRAALQPLEGTLF